MTIPGPRDGGGIPLEMHLGRYPGPVWMLAVWSFLSAANLAFAVSFPGNYKPSSVATNVSLALAAGMTVLLLTLGPRLPRWLLWVLFHAGVAASLWLALDAITPLGTVLFAMPTTIFAMYVALWAQPNSAYVFLAVLAAAILAVLAIKGYLPYMLVSWLLLISISAALVGLLTYLVRNLKLLATTDPTTGLLNRHGLDALLHLMPSAGRRTAPRTLVVIDLDGFKELNDTRGHQAGDEVLRTFGQALRASAREDDIVARTGGDEFVLILPATQAADAERLLDRLRILHPARWSHGVAQWDPGTTYGDVFADADARMYQAKQRRSADPEPGSA